MVLQPSLLFVVFRRRVRKWEKLRMGETGKERRNTN